MLIIINSSREAYLTIGRYEVIHYPADMDIQTFLYLALGMFPCPSNEAVHDNLNHSARGSLSPGICLPASYASRTVYNIQETRFDTHKIFNGVKLPFYSCELSFQAVLESDPQV